MTEHSASDKPSVLFVCVKNGGKSQMAAGLLENEAAGAIDVDSAGTSPGSAVNELAAQVLMDVGVDISANSPKQLTEDAMLSATRVVVLGQEAQVPDVAGAAVEVWDIDEPSLRGIEGQERMELVRDDIQARVKLLKDELLAL